MRVVVEHGRSVQVEIGRTDTRFRELHDRRDALYRAVALAVGDVWVAAEAIDEAMTRAYERWDRVASYDNPEGWVYRVAVNWSRSALRKRRNEVLQDAVPEQESAERSPDFELRDALQRLPVRFRAVVVARFLLDWSTEETATALRIPEGTVKSRLKRGLHRLAVDLEGEES